MRSQLPYGYIVSYATAPGVMGHQDFYLSSPWNRETAANVCDYICTKNGICRDKLVITSIFAFDASEEI